MNDDDNDNLEIIQICINTLNLCSKKVKSWKFQFIMNKFLT